MKDRSGNDSMIPFGSKKRFKLNLRNKIWPSLATLILKDYGLNLNSPFGWN